MKNMVSCNAALMVQIPGHTLIIWLLIMQTLNVARAKTNLTMLQGKA